MTTNERREISRRGFIGSAGALGALWVVGAVGGAAPARAVERALEGTAKRAVATAGTTLESVAARVSATGYTRLRAGEGWPLMVRVDLAAANAARDDNRSALASFVQFTDVHVVDSESPVRFEYVHPFTGSAYRPHEVLSTQGTSSLVRRVNSLVAGGQGGPFTGRPFDCMVSTGDNTDNHEHVELNWMLTSFNGGSITPTTGDPAHYEGVQNSGVPLYWNPESAMRDLYKDHGFPQIPGLLSAAMQQFEAPGINLPWYSVFGNHDDSVQGTLPSGIPFFDDAYTGSLKIEGAGSEAAARNLVDAMANRPQEVAALLPETAGLVRTVTPTPGAGRSRRRSTSRRTSIRPTKAARDRSDTGSHRAATSVASPTTRSRSGTGSPASPWTPPTGSASPTVPWVTRSSGGSRRFWSRAAADISTPRGTRARTRCRTPTSCCSATTRRPRWATYCPIPPTCSSPATAARRW